MNFWSNVTKQLKQNNYVDFQQLFKDNLELDRSYLETISSANANNSFGSGIVKKTPNAFILFDSSNLTESQSQMVAASEFDGQGILSEPYNCSDTLLGNNIKVSLEGRKSGLAVKTLITVIGKIFDSSLVYEHFVFDSDGQQISKNHFTQVVNILTSNYNGNLNTSVDGYGSVAFGGTLIISECNGFELNNSLNKIEQIKNPDYYFANYKVYDSTKSLNTILQEAIGASNDVDALDINTTATASRLFESGASVTTIYGQKFKANSNNIQKISLAFKLESGDNWTGSISVGIRALQNTNASVLGLSSNPDNEFDFDPATVAIEEVTLSKADFEKQGAYLSEDSYKIVDFVFSNTKISNPALNLLEIGQYYVITVKRIGSTTTGTLILDEFQSNTDETSFLTVFSGSSWTDIKTSSLWFSISSLHMSATNGTAYIDGSYAEADKVLVGLTTEQKYLSPADLLSSSAKNYFAIESVFAYDDLKIHPSTGAQFFSTKRLSPSLACLAAADVSTYLDTYPSALFIGSAQDKNQKEFTSIDGYFNYPGQAIGNKIYIIDPGSTLNSLNLVGSIITPNQSKQNKKYRIVSALRKTRLIGDINNDGYVSTADLSAWGDLDGYSVDGTVIATHASGLLNESFNIIDLLANDIDQDGYITTDDYTDLYNYVVHGTAYPAGETIVNYLELEVEPLNNAAAYYDSDGYSTLILTSEDSSLISIPFSSISYNIEYCPRWNPASVEVIDTRRFVNGNIFSQTASDVTNNVPQENHQVINGNLYLGSTILNKDGTNHSLDYEKFNIVIELPAGEVIGELNIPSLYLIGIAKFSDGTFVNSSSLANNQVKMSLSISSYAKNLGAVDYDGYSDGYDQDSDESIGAYLNSSTGLLTIKAYNIVNNSSVEEIRTRLVITVELKKAGFANEDVLISGETLLELLR